MAWIDGNGLRFRVVEHGIGTPLVLLHGFTGSADSWSAIAEKLASAHRVIALDLLGHGCSDSPDDPERYKFNLVLDDLAGVFNALGLSQTALLGYSMGGRLALGFALRHPRLVSALIIESASPGIRDAETRAQRRASDDALAQRIERDGVPAFVHEWERLPKWQSQRSLPVEVLHHQRELRLRNCAHGLANSLRGMGQGVQPSLWDRLGAIDVPVLAIAGALDTRFAGIAIDMAASFPDAAMCIVPDTGHAVHLERPEAFSKAVANFLANCDIDAVQTQEENAQ